MDLGRLTTPQRISAAAILVVVLAAFLPWASLFGMSVSGIDGDGVITLVLAVAGGLVLVLTSGLTGKQPTAGRWPQLTLVVLAALVALIALIDMSGIAAIGLYLTLFAGLAWVVGAIWQLNLSKQASTPASAAPTED